MPYAAAPRGELVTLPDMLHQFLFISEHRQLAPLLLANAAALTLVLVAVHQRWLLITAVLLSCSWGFLMLAIPMGLAHVRPAFGYWINQSLLLIEIGVLIASIQNQATH